ncbi:MAG: ATP-dependent Clp protease adaptor ClpS [Chloroherpetonaceae bacterium]|nr:ATP-dependent Clp protease adaptor ClpS [Chthonomonadaceae bacterium]MDW8208799.1 ATP-dependent Clp protease adaptor ClpS [Chloroherpetonaceae bacterium]
MFCSHRITIRAAATPVVEPKPVAPSLPDQKEHSDDIGTRSHYIVVVYDNDYNTFDEVILILMKATACSLQEAQIETWEIHHLGKSVVHYGSKPECERVARVIRTIGIRVEVCEE